MKIPLRRWAIPLLIILAPLAGIASLPGANPVAEELDSPRGYVCMNTITAPVIDGKLDDPAWKNAPWSADFVDIEGNKKPKPWHRTRMKMLWDAKGLYIAAELEEPHIWATLKEHDSVIFHDPDFEVFIDPDGDNFLYGELELNALNTTWDLLLPKPYKDGGRALNGWEVIGLKTAVQINGTLNNPADTDKSWTVEIFWPWEGLKELSSQSMPPRDGDQWRINFSRVEWDTNREKGAYEKVKGKPEHNWVWSPQGMIDMHRPEHWGYLQFSKQTSGKVDFKKDPDFPVRKYLHELYYSQKTQLQKKGAYASNIKDLAIEERGFGIPQLLLTPRGYEITLRQGGTTFGINSESYFWRSAK